MRKARYVSKDPIGLFGGLNNSIYVSNPNQWIDPMGLNQEWINIKTGERAGRKKGPDWENWFPYKDPDGRLNAAASSVETKLNTKRQQEIESYNYRIETTRKSENVNNAWNQSVESMNIQNKLLSKRIPNVNFICECKVTLWGSIKEDYQSGEILDNGLRCVLGVSHGFTMGLSTIALRENNLVPEHLLDTDHVAFNTADNVVLLGTIVTGRGVVLLKQGAHLSNSARRMDPEQVSYELISNVNKVADKKMAKGLAIMGGNIYKVRLRGRL
ncbi:MULTISPECIES: hypothetical protein [unclassified Acinetobacter]|uniref:hypothetical protein n=1 Tax=unclassified Acinetobacter TaxID=196816 RepID=UPI00211F317D|nr:MULTISPECIES: hypothetical protein [unclassified Acinetobacter]